MFGILVRLAGLAATDVSGALRRAKWMLAAYAAIALLVGVAIAFGLVSLFVQLSSIYDPISAGLIIAGASLGLALLIVIAIQTAAYFRRRRLRRLSAQRALQTAALFTQIAMVARRKPLLTALVVGGLAFVATRGGGKD
ncbi:MAG: hypothetical protein H6883_13515 [Rhodobiaceae bacterium]|nr:hypothetical protein [Rhodobiaceae bacterium]MCC0057135.1 hypothetical protein [Rhodobiaceae bacterium]